MRSFKLLTASVALTGLMAATIFTQSASAQTFAQFRQQATGNSFKLANTSGNGTLTATSVPIVFTFLDYADSRLIGRNILGLLTLTSSTQGSFAEKGTGASASQDFGATAFTFTAQGAQTVNGVSIASGALLLSGKSGDAAGGNPTLIGNAGGTLSGTVTSSTAGSPGFGGADVAPDPIGGTPGNDVVFMSNFIEFNNNPNENDTYAFSFSSAVPNFSFNNNGTPGNPFDDFINPFQAAGTGTFSAVVAVPEPGAVALLSGLGVVGTVLGFRRRRR